MADQSGFSRNPKPPALAGGSFTVIADGSEYDAAKSNVGHAATQTELENIVKNENSEIIQSDLIASIKTLSNPSYFRHWGTRSPKCKGGAYSTYDCMNSHSGIDYSDADLWYLAYNHLAYRLGIPLPKTYTTINEYESSDLLPSDQHVGLSKWEGVMYYVGVHRNHYNTWQDCGVIHDRLYSFRNANSWKHIFRDGTNIVQLGSSPTGDHRKYKTIIRGQFEGDKYYGIQHTPSANMIEVVVNPSVVDGANVINVSQANTSRSQFTFEGRAGGLCRIKPRSAQETENKEDYCLNIANGDTSHTANVQQGLCASDSSDWIITRH